MKCYTHTLILLLQLKCVDLCQMGKNTIKKFGECYQIKDALTTADDEIVKNASCSPYSSIIRSISSCVASVFSSL